MKEKIKSFFIQFGGIIISIATFLFFFLRGRKTSKYVESPELAIKKQELKEIDEKIKEYKSNDLSPNDEIEYWKNENK